MTTGTLPFSGQTQGQTLEAIFTKVPVAPVRLNPQVPAELERIISKAMEKDRNLRYQSAAELRTDLQRLKRDTSHPSHSGGPTSVPASVETSKKTSKAPLWIGVAAIVVVLLAAALFYSRQKTEPPAAASTKIAIAVLPFTNLSADKEQEYFSDGLSEELLNVLAKNPKLQVTSRTSAFSFKGKEVDIKTIAQKLNVTHVLEGSVRKAGNQLRITAQLIEVASDSHLWSQTYDRQLENVFAIQDEIAGSVATALKTTLEGSKVSNEKGTNPQAYNAYLQGRYFSSKKSKVDSEKAIAYFEQAVKIDPNYAPGWLGLSDTHGDQAGAAYIPMQEGFAKSRKELQKALELDPNFADAYASLGWIKRVQDWDWAGADAAYKKAFELEPENSGAMQGAAVLASTLGDFDKSITLNRRVTELDPVRATAYSNLAIATFFSGRFDEAEAAIQKALELSPQFSGLHVSLGRIYLVQSKNAEALAEIEKEQNEIWREFGLALAYHALGRKKEGDVTLSEYINKYQDDAAYQVACIYAYRGEVDKAFEWLDRAYNLRDGGLTEMKGDPMLRNLERDPRYTAFLQKMKLPVD
jgi:TolB-like protein/Flp pilus assembly protein TadD